MGGGLNHRDFLSLFKRFTFASKSLLSSVNRYREATKFYSGGPEVVYPVSGPVGSGSKFYQPLRGLIWSDPQEAR